ncbi:MAG: MBL fold metallo-hydrolase [Spirochaetales bacterium]|nr:MBL fold metallo-hydrolase [Spirochaetales bacterium]
MRIRQVSPSLYAVQIAYVKVFLIKGDDGWTLIDTGFPGRGKAILQAMKKAGLEGPVNQIIITQLHGDHTGSLHYLKDATGAKVYAHELETKAIETGLTMRSCVPASGAFKWFVTKVILRGGKPTYLKEGTTVDIQLKGGEILPFGPGLEVIHTPGHTTGHICLLLKEEGNILIAGDVATGGRAPTEPMLFENESDGKISLDRLGKMSFDKAVFAHGKTIKGKASKLFRKAFPV